MNYFRYMIGCALCLTVVGPAGCKPTTHQEILAGPKAEETPATPTPTSAPATPTATPTPTPGKTKLEKLAESVAPAVVLVTVFDQTGKLLRSGTGFFVSDNGRIVTPWRTVDGAVNAVAKTADGGLYNIGGVVAGSAKLGLAVLNAEVKTVPALVLSNKDMIVPDTRVAVIGSALAGKEGAPVEGAISRNESDEDKFDLAASVPEISLGAPVVDENGEVIGLVTERNDKAESPSIVRSASTVKSIMAGIQSNATARWPAERPSPTPKPRIVSAPKPIYPAEAQFHDGIARSGRYRVNFAANGTVKNVQVLNSTGLPVLDAAAIKGLEQWRCEPGREGNVIVPLTFQSR
ncbi:MAG: TonB family protein [Verrucomicrobiota bacterium]